MVALSARCRWKYLPVVRGRIFGSPIRTNVANFNRSDVIRRIFIANGRIGNERVKIYLATEGLEASDTLINKQRNYCIAQGWI